jgi:alpha-ketoglutarate-dependent taurine dioxygenase
MIKWQEDPSALPLIGTAEQQISHDQVEAWFRSNKDKILELLYAHGALLFRGFGVSSPEQFRSIAAVFCDKLGDYVGGNSPRTQVASNVFTSTEYPKEEKISMHNEASYLKEMPRTILFFCATPASTGGQTPLADSRRVLQHIDPQVRGRFDRRGVRYVNNLHGGVGVGKSWMEAYCTKDRKEVEERLKAGGQTFEWKKDGGLKTWMQAPATLRHSKTLQEVWINQAEQWHSSSLDSDLREDLLSVVGEDGLPHNAFFGDGSPLNTSDLENIRKAMATEERTFVWQQGDVLLCDNFLVMHGRQPYTGPRKILAAMG